MKEDNQSIEENEEDMKVDDSKAEIEKMKFELELLKRKNETSESTISKLRAIESDYQLKYSSLVSEYKCKMDEMKQKFKSKEEAYNNEITQKEIENEKNTSMLKIEVKRLQDVLIAKDKELDKYKTKSLTIDSSIKIKEKEYVNLLGQKDQRIEDLQAELDRTNEEKNKLINELQYRNQKLSKEISEIRKEQYTTSFNNNIATKKITTEQESIHSRSHSTNINNAINIDNNNDVSHHSISTMTPYDCSKIKELREKVAELENETISLTRELSLKYEECDALTDEIVRLRGEIQSNKLSSQYSKVYYNNMNNNSQNDIANDIKLSNLEMLVNNYGQNIMMLKQSYEDVCARHKEEMEKMSREYESRIDKLLSENNDLKREINRGAMISETIRSGRMSKKDIHEIVGDDNINTPSFNDIDSQIKALKDKISKMN